MAQALSTCLANLKVSVQTPVLLPLKKSKKKVGRIRNNNREDGKYHNETLLYN
jgi:ribosomal protein S30